MPTPPPPDTALRRASEILSDLLEVDPAETGAPPSQRAGQADATLELGPHTLLLEWKSSSDVAAVGAAIRQLEASRQKRPEAVPVVAVPFMGDAGKALCREHAISWLDLSGNAHLRAPGFRVRMTGAPNRYKRDGRPSTPFAPRSSRVTRYLLQHPDRAHRQTDIASATGLGAGYTSRVVGRLIGMELLHRDAEGAVRVRDPALLLRAWCEQDDFTRHHIVRGHIASRGGEELLTRTATELGASGLRHAATGLGAAWMWTGFAQFRSVAWYVDAVPEDLWLERVLGFHSDERGANVWWVVPKDEGVFLGAQDIRGVPCVHPVQAWVDLSSQPERSAEAAEQLAQRCLPWAMS